MRFLIDADLPRSIREPIVSRGHEAIDVRDLGLRAAPDSAIAARALEENACLVTGDFDFADIRNYPPEAWHGIVVLVAPPRATARTFRALMSALLESDVVSRLPGRLAVVEPGRIRLRPT